MKKYVRNTGKVLAILIGVLVIMYIAAYAYITANKKYIIQQIKEQVADKLNGDIQINNIGLSFLNTFPRISVLLENVTVKDTLFSVHHHPFFQAEKVYINLGLAGILQKSNSVNGIYVKNGQLYIYKDTSGYTNAYLFSPKSADNKTTSKESGSNTGIDNIKLRGVRLILNDQLKGKLYDLDVTKSDCAVTTEDSTIRFKTKNNILIHNLAFNTKVGSFLKEARFEGDSKVLFDKILKQLTFDDLDVKIKDQLFNLSGVFNFTKSSFLLKATTKNIDYNFARSLLTERNSKALSVAKIEKPIDEITVEISGPLKGGNQLVNATWKCNGNNIQSSYANFTNCSFNGFYTNEIVAGLPRKDSNSRIQFSNFKGDWEGFPIKSQKIYIDNLKAPMVNANIKTDFDLTQLNTLLGSNNLDMREGKGLLDIIYSGPLQQNTNKNTLLNGKLTFSNGVLMYHPRNMEFKNVNGNIVFKNSDIFVTDLRGNVQGNKLVMNGSGKNLLALMKTNPGKMFLDWNIYSPSLDLGSFTSLLKKRTVRKKNVKSKLGDNLDEIVNLANFRLDVKTDELKFKRFTATNVKGSVSLINQNWALNNVSLNHGGGSMVINGSLNEKNSKYFESNINVNIQNVDVNKIFYAFNDFGQHGISSENLRGKLTSSANVKMNIDRDLEETPTNMAGTIQFSLKNGALLHYEPLRKIGDIALDGRNFDKIYFAELKDRFDIKDREIIINKMEIQSTVLTLFVEGIYSLRGNTDISIQVPLNNIKIRGEDYKVENKGVNAKGGASVFVRGTPGDDGKIKFKLDLFRKFRKKDNKDKEDKKKDKREAKSKS